MYESSSTKIGIFMIFISFCTFCQNVIGQHTLRKKHEIAWEVFFKICMQIGDITSEKGILSSHLPWDTKKKTLSCLGQLYR